MPHPVRAEHRTCWRVKADVWLLASCRLIKWKSHREKEDAGSAAATEPRSWYGLTPSGCQSTCCYSTFLCESVFSGVWSCFLTLKCTHDCSLRRSNSFYLCVSLLESSSLSLSQVIRTSESNGNITSSLRISQGVNNCLSFQGNCTLYLLFWSIIDAMLIRSLLGEKNTRFQLSSRLKQVCTGYTLVRNSALFDYWLKKNNETQAWILHHICKSNARKNIKTVTTVFKKV